MDVFLIETLPLRPSGLWLLGSQLRLDLLQVLLNDGHPVWIGGFDFLHALRRLHLDERPWLPSHSQRLLSLHLLLLQLGIDSFRRLGLITPSPLVDIFHDPWMMVNELGYLPLLGGEGVDG